MEKKDLFFLKEGEILELSLKDSLLLIKSYPSKERNIFK